MIREFLLVDDDLQDRVHKEIGRLPGVYELFCREKGDIKPVPRLLDIDYKGTLFIGYGKECIRRVEKLRKTIQYKSKLHTCGNRYNKNKIIHKAFPTERLYVRTIAFDNPREVIIEILHRYLAKYGELPPLNNSIDISPRE